MTDYTSQPGDVAMVQRSESVWEMAIRGGWGNGAWVFADGTIGRASTPIARQLAVIDPEAYDPESDDDDVNRLTRLLVEAMHKAGHISAAASGLHPSIVQAALREYITPTPPEPEEPKGLGAVVEDRSGTRIVRVGNPADYPWTRVVTGSRFDWGSRLSWADLPRPLTVLSEGIE